MKKNMMILSAVLVLGGQAQAVTGDDLLAGAGKALEGLDWSFEDLLNPRAAIDRAIGTVFKSVPNTIVKAGLKDFLTSIKMTNRTAEKIQDIMSNGSSSTAFKTLKDSNEQLSFVLNHPFDSGGIEKYGNILKNDLQKFKKFIDMNTDQTPEGQSLRGNVGQKLVNSGVVNDLKDQANDASTTGILVAQSEELVTMATDEKAQALNKKMSDQVKTAGKRLSQETRDAVSTRAVMQSFNTAFASFMAQDQFGNEQLQGRLNLMVKQGAITNTQLGDIIGEMRKEGVAATAQQRERVLEDQRVAIQAIDGFRKQAGAMANAISYAGNAAVGAAVTLNGGVPIAVPRPKTSVIPDPNSPVPNSPVPNNPVEIVVPRPGTTVIPGQAPAPGSTAPGSMVADPVVASGALPAPTGQP